VPVPGNLYDWQVCVRDNRVEQLWRSPPAAPFIELDASPSIPHHPRRTSGMEVSGAGVDPGY
jgi:hypothetical protein